MKKLRCLHLIPNLGLGGAEKIVFSICRTLNRDQFSPVVACWGEREWFLDDFKKNNIEVIRLPFEKVISLKSVRFLRRFLRDQKIDILHTHFMDADLLGILASWGLKIPLCIHIHSYPFPVKKSHIWRYRIIAKLAKKIICVSRIEHDFLIRQSPSASAKTQVVYNGIDSSCFQESLSAEGKKAFKQSLQIDAGKKVITYIARLVEEKGHRFLLDAVRLIFEKRDDVVLLLVGDGPCEEELKHQTRHLGIDSKVIFLGKRKDTPNILQITDICCSIGETEALGLSVLEAMAAGKAIIAACDGGIPELIRERKEGLLVDPHNSEEISQKIAFFFDNPQEACKMGDAAQKRSQKFTEDIMTNEIETIYTKICV